MMQIIAYIAISYLAYQVLVALVNLLTGQYLKQAKIKDEPMVSILVPARNEEENIGMLLDDLLRLDYKNYEVLVYDDDSSDRTGQIVQEKCRDHTRIQYFKGSGPTPGWLGKNHACHELAGRAKGDFLLFLDADVRVKPGLVKDSAACMQKYGTDLLTLFPVQKMISPGEWLTVPLMNRILVGNLPLALVRLVPWSAFTAANGQFMMFRAGIYRQYGLHDKVRNEKVEDIVISAMMKRAGLKVQVLLSGGQVSCRMYRGFAGGVDGFSRNIHAFFGKNWLLLFLYAALTTLGPFAVWMSFSFGAMTGYLAGTVFFRALVSFQSRQSVVINTLLMPLQQVSLIIIAVLAAYRHVTGSHYWKGRRI